MYEWKLSVLVLEPLRVLDIRGTRVYLVYIYTIQYLHDAPICFIWHPNHFTGIVEPSNSNS